MRDILSKMSLTGLYLDMGEEAPGDIIADVIRRLTTPVFSEYRY